MTLRWSPGYAAVDADFDSVSLLLHGDGTNGSTTIVDNSPSPKTVTAVGNAQISTAQSKFGGASIAFDGTGDYAVSAKNADFEFGTGDFTVEMWVYLNAAGGALINTADNGNMTTGGWQIDELSRWAVGKTSYIVVGTFTYPGVGQWFHLAVCRAGSTTRGFINGSTSAGFVANNSTDIILSGTNELSVGSRRVAASGLGSYGQFLLNGYIDDLRITKGVARYTSNFTPPTEPFPDLSPTTRLTLP